MAALHAPLASHSVVVLDESPCPRGLIYKSLSLGFSACPREVSASQQHWHHSGNI